MRLVTVNGVRYYKCGSTWYNRVIDGTNDLLSTGATQRFAAAPPTIW